LIGRWKTTLRRPEVTPRGIPFDVVGRMKKKKPPRMQIFL
jgi:hypothetical protein